MEHHFDLAIAKRFGVNGAILIHNLNFWISKNKANKKHFYDGEYWTYNSIAAFTELFPYWTSRQLERIISNLVRDGAVIKGNYNKSPYDRTTWYALTDTVKHIYANGSAHFTKRGNVFAQTVEPIPDSKQDNKQTDNKQHISNFEKFGVQEDLEPLEIVPIQVEIKKEKQRKKVAQKKESFGFGQFVDAWRSVEINGTKFDFQINNSKNVGQYQNILKAIKRDLASKYGEYTDEKLAESVQVILQRAYLYFSSMYKEKISSTFLFEPVYVYTHYNKIKTFRSTDKNTIDRNELKHLINEKYGNLQG